MRRLGTVLAITLALAKGEEGGRHLGRMSAVGSTATLLALGLAWIVAKLSHRTESSRAATDPTMRQISRSASAIVTGAVSCSTSRTDPSAYRRDTDRRYAPRCSGSWKATST